MIGSKSLLLAFLILATVGAGLVWADDVVSIDDLKQMMADKKYRDVVQKASRALTMTAQAAPRLQSDGTLAPQADPQKAADRYALLMIKAEAQLQLKQNINASDTFALAAKQAQNPNDALAAVAIAELAKKSPNLTYVPAARGTGPIDITDNSDRKAAYVALYVDMSASLARTFKDATESTTLPPIMNALKFIPKLRAVEIAATGADTQTQAVIKDVGSQGADLISRQLRKDASAVESISENANMEVEVITPGGAAGNFKNGLSTKDKQQLKDVISECESIVPVAKEMADETDFDSLKAVVGEVNRVGTAAAHLLGEKFGQSMGGSFPTGM